MNSILLTLVLVTHRIPTLASVTIDYYKPLELVRAYTLFTAPPPKSFETTPTPRIQFCPIAETDIQQWQDDRKNLSCIAENTKQKQKCQHEITPNLTRTTKNCGNNGIEYNYQYDICVPSPQFIYVTSDTPNHVFASIYSACIYDQTATILYTEHSITSSTPNEPISRKNFSAILHHLVSNDGNILLKDIAAAYLKILTDDPQPSDYFLPQMLVPYTDMDLQFARDSLFHTLYNIQPQYNHLHDTWNLMVTNIWNYLNTKQLRAKIITGVSDPLIIDDQPVYFAVNDDFRLPVSSIWWKLIRIPKIHKSYFVAFHNIPTKYDILSRKRICATNICHKGDFLELADLLDDDGELNECPFMDLNVNDDSILIEYCEPSVKILKLIGLESLSDTFLKTSPS